MTNGWIKLHKKIKDWEWYGDPATRSVFIHLLLSVNYEKGYWRGIEILAGQAPIGRKQLARDLGFSEQQIRRALNNLQNSQQITIKSTNKHSVVTVCQWESYQSVNEKAPTNQPQNNHETNRKTTTLKEVKKKENKESIYTDSFETFWQSYPKRQGSNPKKPAKEKFIKLVKSGISADEITKGAREYAQQQQSLGHLDTPYVAQATTWLNQERWKDQCVQENVVRIVQSPPPIHRD